MVHVSIKVLVLIFFSFDLIEGKIIYLNETKVNDYTVKSGDNVTILCMGISTPQWKTPIVTNKDYMNYTRMSISTSSSNRRNNHITRLDIINITFPFVGFYSCFGKKNFSHAKTLYLYVHDEHHLAVFKTEKNQQKTIYTVRKARTVIPCRPTSLDVNVSLRTRGGNIIEMNSTEDIYSFDFDPHEGFFTVPIEQDGGDWDCKFIRNNRTEDFWFSLKVEEPMSDLAVPYVTAKKTHFVVGDKLILECIVKSDVKTLIKWILPSPLGKTSNPTTHNIIYKDINDIRFVKSTLRIDKVNMSHGGQYTCFAEDKQNHSSQSEIRVFVHESEDKFIIFRKPVISQYSDHTVGTSVEWTQGFEAYPEIKVAWFDNEGQHIRNSHSEKYKVIIADTYASLKIKNINFDDHGNYTLLLNNGSENSTQIQFLNVTGKPVVELYMDKFQLPHISTKIDCKVTSNPSGRILIEYKPCLHKKCRYRKLFSQTEKEGLRVTESAQIIFNESSTVKCSSENIFGHHEVKKVVYVTEVPYGFDVNVNDSETIFYKSKNKALVALGQSVRFSCRAFLKNNNEYVEWRNGSSKIVADEKFALIDKKSPSSMTSFLVIKTVTKAEHGTYSCNLIENTKVVNVTKIKIIVCEPFAPKIKSFFNETQKSLGDYVNFDCKYSGIPKATVSWFKDDEEITISENVVLAPDKISLTIKKIKLEDEGEYRCEATNKLGMAQWTWPLEIKDKQSGIFYWLVIIILVILVLITSVIVYLKDHRKKKLEKLLREIGLAYFEQGKLENLNPDLGLEDQAELLPYDKKWEFPPENLKIGKQLGAGAFGVVMKGEAKGIIPGEERSTVAVKMVKKNAGHTYIKALASELKIMVHLGNHLNVVNLLGACTKNVAKGQLFVIVEFCIFGNTHNYLYRHRNEFIDQIDRTTGTIDSKIGKAILERSYSVASNQSVTPMKYVTQLSTKSNNMVKNLHTSENEAEGSSNNCKIVSIYTKTEEGEDEIFLSNNSSTQPEWRTNYTGDYKGSVRPICTKDLLIWAFQVAKGMEYLASRKVLHGDLAARNILLADENVVKICDFGLAKRMYKDANYKKNTNCPLPIKWMAIESIRDGVFSTQSDVWSFGVALWEFFSLARTPYPGMEADERLFVKLIEGYRMEAPEYATNEIYQMILECWSLEPRKRPSFSNLADRLGRIIGQPLSQHYIDLNDPYLKCNIQKREECGFEDYLDRVNSPNYDSQSSPNIYVNQQDHSPGYLSMRSPEINSPRPDNQDAFNFDVKRKKISNASSRLQDDVFLEEEEDAIGEGADTLEKSELENTNKGNSVEDYTNPSYMYPQKREDCDPKEGPDRRPASDKYILMTQIDNLQNLVQSNENNQEKVYINDFPLLL